MVENDPWQAQLRALGSFIRTQRQLADLSLREMGDLAKISNAYLSQVERGLHQPSVRVLRSIAAALGVPADELLAHAGLTSRSVPAKPSPADARSSDSNASDAEGEARPESFPAAVASAVPLTAARSRGSSPPTSSPCAPPPGPARLGGQVAARHPSWRRTATSGWADSPLRRCDRSWTGQIG